MSGHNDVNYKITKKLYKRTIIGSSRRDCVLIILFNFMTLRLCLVIYSGWATMTPPTTFIIEEELIQY